MLCSRTIFNFKRFNGGSVLSLGPGCCNTSYMHSYKWFSIIRCSLWCSACSRWKSCRIFRVYRWSHHIFQSEMAPFCRCSCAHRVRNFSVHVFSVMMALSIFHYPRPIRMIGKAIDMRRHTARWSVNGATTVSISSVLASSSCVGYIWSIRVFPDIE
jgi:hypothetical protein